MIETNYHILPPDIYQECNTEAKELGINIDHYLMEFCQIESTDVYVDE